MSHNRHMSLLRKFRKNKSKKRKTKSEQSSAIGYDTLEPRQLLAIDFGVGSGLVDVTTDTFGGGPNVSGAVGPNHIVQVQDGEFRIYDKFTGANLVDKDLDTFWTDTGNGADVGAEADDDMVGGTKNARVVYDADTRRWFIVASPDNSVDIITGTGADGSQIPVLVAVSRTSDPTLDWQSMQDTYDDDNDIVNGEGDPPTPPVTFTGGFLPDRTRANNTVGWSLNLAVDDDNLLITVDGPVNKTYAFNKFALLVVPTPTAGANFPNAALGFDATSGGQQWNTDVKGVVAGTFGLETSAGVTGGNSIILSELTGTASVHGATAQPDVIIPVDAYEEPPIFIRQEADPDLVNASSAQTGSPVRLGNSLWAVHAIRGSFDAQNPDGGTVQNSAIRWYEIDLDTNTVKQSGTIQHEWKNYIYPTIAATDEGHVVIGFTSTGVAPAGQGFGQFPSVAVSVGYSINGTMTFEDPVVVKDGDGGYLDAIGNFWGSYMSTVADPNDPEKVWIFGQWSTGAAIPNGQNQITEIKLLGHSPTIVADATDNTIIVRKSALDPTQVEVEIDGIVVATYEETKLYDITLDGAGGSDTFIIDTSNGEFDLPNGVNFIGDGDDQVVMDAIEDINFEVFVDGSGTASVGTNILADCEDHDDVEQIFILNFEAGSGWFDATPYGVDGYATRGDALRGDLQQYFDQTIAPLFDGSFTIELDINDDAIDTLASARALGVGLEDVNGQDLQVGSPWSILAGYGDRTVGGSDGVIDYNLDVALYQDDFEALRENISGGLSRSQFFKILGMISEIPNETNTFDPRGTRNFATVMDVGYHDLNDVPLLGNYSAADSMFDVLAYQSNAIWAGDNSGIYFSGIDDNGSFMPLFVNSNAELIDFDTLASSLSGTSRNGDFHDIIEQDRAFLRGLGLSLNAVTPVEQLPGLPVRFEGVDRLQSGAGEDYFCILSSNVDLDVRGGNGNDFFNVTGLGVGAINLFGESGDDTYQVVFSPAGVITISDSINSENDTLVGLGTSAEDRFVFDVGGVEVNAGLMVYVGIENISFDGRDSDDIFEVKAAYAGITQLVGGDGLDTFIVNDEGAGGNGNVLTVSVVDPLTDPVDQLKLDITSLITDTYYSVQIENLAVDGMFVIDAVNGTPTVDGGLNLLGDGDERLRIESALDAEWLINGNGAGTVTMDVEPMTFVGLNVIEGSHGVDTVVVQITGTDLQIDGRESDDEITINNASVGVVTFNGGIGSDTMSVVNSGGGVNLNGNGGGDLFTFDDLGAGPANLSGGGGADLFQILNSGTAGLSIDGDAGVDTFNVTNPLGTADTVIRGGDDNDLFNVVDSGLGALELQGESGDDTYVVTYVDPTITFRIIDSLNAEDDTLFAIATDGDDVMDVSGNGFALNGGVQWTVTGIENLNYDGLEGDDQFNVNMGSGWSDTLNLSGAAGNDTFAVNDGGAGLINLDGEAGDDTYIVHFTPTANVVVTDSVGSESDSFFGFGTGAADLLTIAGSMANVNGGTAVWSGVESAEFDARSGNDVYALDAVFGNTRFLGGTGNDTFDVATTTPGNVFMGNSGNDVFNLTMTTGNVDFLGGDDDDLFNIGSATGVSSFLGELGMDRFVVTNHVAPNSSGLIEIDGGGQRNEIVVNGYQTISNLVTVTNDRITGMSGVPIRYVAAGSFSIANQIGGVELVGSDNNNDDFEIVSTLKKNSLKITGGGGEDRFSVRRATLGSVSADGQEGSDLYQYEIGSDNNRYLFAFDTGVVGLDRIVANLTDDDDQLVMSGEGFAIQTDNFTFNKNFEAFVVNSREGNDTVDLYRVDVGFLRVMTRGGNDEVRIHNFRGVNTIRIEAGAGDDSIIANVGTVPGMLLAYGGTGDDYFMIAQGSYGNTVFDGQEGSDRYDVHIADRSDRYVVARDSGFTGVDEMTVFGTVLNDRFTLRSGLVATQAQSIYYNENTEVLNLDAGGGDDIATVYGISSATTNISMSSGADLAFVKSTHGVSPTKELNVDLGAGNDAATVSGTNSDTSTSVYGGSGNDVVNVGSTLGDYNGNLDLVQGAVHFEGNDGDDRLYLNDAGKNASYKYNVGPTSVMNGSAGFSYFAGVTYDATVETLRLDATKFKTQVNVTASADTAMNFYGGLGLNSITLLGNPLDDGRVFNSIDPTSGYWTFTNGQKNVFFEDFVQI